MTKRIDRPRVKNTWNAPPSRRRNGEADFWAKVDKTSGDCWLWQASVNTNGYGQFRMANVRYLTHRLAYQLVKGEIPAGLQLDHLCRVRHCCNPEHLEPVTLKENVLRGIGHSAQNARATHCHEGHEFVEDNTYRDARGQRHCRECSRRRNREDKARRRELIAADPSLAEHGKANTYSRWACRCEECSSAWSAYMAEYNRRRKDRAA